MLFTFGIGLVFAAAYLWGGRSLWPVVTGHSVTKMSGSVGMTRTLPPLGASCLIASNAAFDLITEPGLVIMAMQLFVPDSYETGRRLSTGDPNRIIAGGLGPGSSRF